MFGFGSGCGCENDSWAWLINLIVLLIILDFIGNIFSGNCLGGFNNCC